MDQEYNLNPTVLAVGALAVAAIGGATIALLACRQEPAVESEAPSWFQPALAIPLIGLGVDRWLGPSARSLIRPVLDLFILGVNHDSR